MRWPTPSAAGPVAPRVALCSPSARDPRYGSAMGDTLKLGGRWSFLPAGEGRHIGVPAGSVKADLAGPAADAQWETTIQGEMVSLSVSSWYSAATARSLESWDLAWCRQNSSSPPPGSTTRTYACAPHRSHRSRLVSVGLVVVPVTPSSTVFVGIWFHAVGVTVPSQTSWRMTDVGGYGRGCSQHPAKPQVVTGHVATGAGRRRRCRPMPARTCGRGDRRRLGQPGDREHPDARGSRAMTVRRRRRCRQLPPPLPPPGWSVAAVRRDRSRSDRLRGQAWSPG